MQYDAWARAAEAENRTVSDWARRVLNRAAKLPWATEAPPRRPQQSQSRSRLDVRATPDQIDGWRAKALADRRSISDWVRLTLDRAASVFDPG